MHSLQKVQNGAALDADVDARVDAGLPEFYVMTTHKFLSKVAYAKVREVTCFSHILGRVQGVNCKIMRLVHLRA